MLNQINPEEPGGLVGAFAAGEYGDPFFQGRAGFRPAGSPDFQLFPVFDGRRSTVETLIRLSFSLTSRSVG
jgi:hypothetical protein